MKNWAVVGLVICMGLAGYGVSAQAATLNVPRDYNTIQEAINAAGSGDTVLVADGTYVENIDFDGKAITVKSVNGAASTIIDGNRNGSVVTFENSESASSVLDGFTITNGNGMPIEYKHPDDYVGGGIHCKNSSPTITNCIISGNSAKAGGGIYCKNSSLTLADCTFSDNSVTWPGHGGGIYCGGSFPSFSTPTLTNCTFRGNSATNGGGIYCYAASPYIVNSIFWGNGSEIYTESGSYPQLSYCDIQGGFSGLGNINADPQFVAPQAGDYHLKTGSPCIDAGHPRIYDNDGSRSDMGTYGGKQQ